MKYINGIIIKIYHFMMKRKWINKNHKINRRIRAMLFHNICYECRAAFGSKNSDRLFYVIRCPQAEMGFFAVLNYIIYHLTKAEQFQAEPVVDWQYYPNKYFTEDEEVGRVNTWEKFFKQTTEITLEEVYQSKNVILSSGDWEIPNKEVFDADRIAQNHKIWMKYFQLNEKTEKKYLEEKGRIGIGTHRVLGVKCRGTDFLTTKPLDHSILPENDQTIQAIEEKSREWGEFDRIFLSTEDQNILNLMKDFYGDKLFYLEGNRVVLTESKWLSELYDQDTPNGSTKEDDMREYLVSTYLLAACDGLIAPEVGGTIGALRIRGNRDQVFIFQLGTYK